MKIRIITREVEGITIVGIIGELTYETEATLRDTISLLIEQGKINFIFDLGKLDYINTGGFRAIVMLLREIRPLGGDIKFMNLRPEIEEVFKVAKFDKICEFFKEERDAINAFKREN